MATVTREATAHFVDDRPIAKVVETEKFGTSYDSPRNSLRNRGPVKVGTTWMGGRANFAMSVHVIASIAQEAT